MIYTTILTERAETALAEWHRTGTRQAHIEAGFAVHRLSTWLGDHLPIPPGPAGEAVLRLRGIR